MMKFFWNIQWKLEIFETLCEIKIITNHVYLNQIIIIIHWDFKGYSIRFIIEIIIERLFEWFFSFQNIPPRLFLLLLLLFEVDIRTFKFSLYRLLERIFYDRKTFSFFNFLLYFIYLFSFGWWKFFFYIN